MIFKEITARELMDFQKQKKFRYLYPQAAEYSLIASNNGLKNKIFAVVENSEILAYGVYLFFKHKKIFTKVYSQFGPVMDFSNIKLVKFYFENLLKKLKSDIRVASLTLSPFVNEKFFDDVEFVSENPIALNVDKILKGLKFVALNRDFYKDQRLSIRTIYTKNIEEISDENLLSNITNKARYTINKTIKRGIKVRDLDLENEEDCQIFDHIISHTSDRLDVKLRTSKNEKVLKKIYKERFSIKLAYIDCDEFISNANKKILSLNDEKDNIIELYNKGDLGKKKFENRSKELQKEVNSWIENIERITKLKEENGNIINISCATFIENGEDYQYFTSGNIQKFSSFEGPYAIQYEMIKDAIRKKYKYYNFLGVSNDLTENSVDHNILLFKRNFNGNIEWFMDNYEIKLNLGKIIG